MNNTKQNDQIIDLMEFIDQESKYDIFVVYYGDSRSFSFTIKELGAELQQQIIFYARVYLDSSAKELQNIIEKLTAIKKGVESSTTNTFFKQS